MKKKKWTEDEVSKELAKINASIPDLLKKNVAYETPATPTMEFIIKKALEDPDFPEDKKAKIRVLLENGDFSKKRVIENAEVTRKIDNMIGRKINQAIKAGKLPPRSEIKNLPWYQKLMSSGN